MLPSWTPRPHSAFALRVVVFAIPIGAALAVTVVASRLFPPPPAMATRVLWWVAMAGLASAVATTTDRIGRRLLPLVALLKLSLVFPDRAPTRMSIALRTGTTRQLRERTEELARTKGATPEVLCAAELLSLVAALNAHDRLTRGHSERVRALADLLADELDLSDDDRAKVRWAALLHDIGKLSVPAEILNKRGRPTAHEWAVIETHPAEGARMIAGPLADWLGDWSRGVVEHHERWDGRGYPRGLRGDEISLAGRLVAVVDAFEVMTSLRSYKQPLSPQAARAELTRCAGSHFDPEMVRAFLQISIGRLRVAMGPMVWLAQVPILAKAPLGTAGTPIAASSGMSMASGIVAAATIAVGVLPNPLSPPQRPAYTADGRTYFSDASSGVSAVLIAPTNGPAPSGDGTETYAAVLSPLPPSDPGPVESAGTATTVGVVDSLFPTITDVFGMEMFVSVPSTASPTTVVHSGTVTTEVPASVPGPVTATTAVVREDAAPATGSTAPKAPAPAAVPTTAAPTSAAPTSAAPSTAAPTTAAPVVSSDPVTTVATAPAPGNSGTAPGQTGTLPATSNGNGTPGGNGNATPGGNGNGNGNGNNGNGNGNNGNGNGNGGPATTIPPVAVTTVPLPASTPAPTLPQPTPPPLTADQLKVLAKEADKAAKDAAKAADRLAREADKLAKDADKAQKHADKHGDAASLAEAQAARQAADDAAALAAAAEIEAARLAAIAGSFAA